LEGFPALFLVEVSYLFCKSFNHIVREKPNNSIKIIDNIF
jgi:hypothetical protein